VCPYKDKNRYRDYMANYMKRQRSVHAQTKQMMLRDAKGMENLRRSFPDAYKLLFGKRRGK